MPLSTIFGLILVTASQNLTETSDLSKRQGGLVEKLAGGVAIRFHLTNGRVGDVWRVNEVSSGAQTVLHRSDMCNPVFLCFFGLRDCTLGFNIVWNVKLATTPRRRSLEFLLLGNHT